MKPKLLHGSTPPITTQRILTFDVADFETDKFICTMSMPFTPPLNMERVLKFVYSKRPSLRYRKIVIEL